jgi:hypothetical protein
LFRHLLIQKINNIILTDEGPYLNFLEERVCVDGVGKLGEEACDLCEVLLCQQSVLTESTDI